MNCTTDIVVTKELKKILTFSQSVKQIFVMDDNFNYVAAGW